MGNRVKQSVGWIIIFILALMLLILGSTGRMGILFSIAFLPDNVAYTGGNN